MGAVCCFSSRSVTLLYQLSQCSWRVPAKLLQISCKFFVSLYDQASGRAIILPIIKMFEEVL